MGELRDRMDEDLRLRRKSENTRRAYLRCVREFPAYHDRSPAQMGEVEVRAFLTRERVQAKVSLRQSLLRLSQVDATTAPQPAAPSGPASAIFSAGRSRRPSIRADLICP